MAIDEDLFTESERREARVGDPKDLISGGSYHGGISLDGQYTVTGYTRLMMKDLLANSAGQQMFLSPHNGKAG